MSTNEDIKWHKRKRTLLDRIRGVPAIDLPTTDDLVKKDKIKILNETMFFTLEGKLIRRIQPGSIIIYLERKNNPMSNWDNWFYVKDSAGVKGLINPVAMINNFEFVE